MKYLKKGTRVPIKNGGSAEVISSLGEGGQGVVYKVKYLDNYYALKWYFYKSFKNPGKFYQNLENNVLKGAPTKDFLWPLFITTKDNNLGSFGYLMDLREDGFYDFGLFLNNKVSFRNDIVVINTALHLVDSFLMLHSKGYSYQDLNDGNFFIEPNDGSILICDNDNVAPYGENVGVDGKSRYMAPEIVVGKSRPNVHTDRFSLAVVLFMHFFRGHPLEGAKTCSYPCLTEDLEKTLFGKSPVFCYDPSNDTNRPVRGIHNNVIILWNTYPKFFKDAFIKVFTKGILDVNERLTEREWKQLLIKLRDYTIKCPCGCENTFDDDINKITCMDCGREITRPLSLSVLKSKILLFPKSRIYESEIIEEGDCYKVAGEVIQNKANPSLWGIKNYTKLNWVATIDERTLEIKPNEVLPICKNLKIKFDDVDGEIN